MPIPASLLRPFRQFYREPLYAIGSAVTLALAVAAATASFAVIKPALFDPLPYRDGHDLVSLLTDTAGSTSAVSAHVLRDLEGAASPLTEFAPIRPSAVTYAGHDSTENVPANLVTASYFSLLGAQAARGRFFTDGEADAAVISWTFWQTTLAGDASVIGRRIRLDGRERTVVGVLEAAFLGPYWPRTDVWLPLDMAPLLADPSRGRRTLTILARRTAPQPEVEAFLTVFTDRMQKSHPSIHGQQAWLAVPLRDELVGPARPALLGTAAAAALLLLIVCANIAGLSAVRAVALRRQLAVRAALGASASRLLRERLADSLAIAVAGSVSGLWLGSVAVAILAGFQRQFLERVAPIQLDATTAGLGLLAGMIAGVITALVPQGAAMSDSGLDGLRGSRGGTGDAATTAVRSGLVVAQVALALVLIVGAGLLMRTVSNLAATPLGFQSDGLTTFGLSLSSRYNTPEKQIQFERDAVNELRRVPGVLAAHASVGVPVIGGMGAALRQFGEPSTAAPAEIAYMSVAPGFLEGIGVPLIAGRSLAESDHSGAPDVLVINETMARTFWPAGNAVGARVQVGSGAPSEEWMTVVGVTADLRQHGPTQAIRPTAFGTTLQYSFPRRNFVLRIQGVPAALAADVRAAMRRVDPTMAIGELQPFDQLVAERTARHRLVMLVLSGFGLVALALCAFGLYAVVALASKMRRREYAIRLALGAGRRRVRQLVLSQGMRLAMMGVAAGLALAVAGTRGLQGLLHGVEPLDRTTFAAAIAIVVLLAVLSALAPAVQAGRVDPAEALKAE